AYLRHLREVPTVAEVERHAHAGSLWQRPLSPARLLHDEIQYIAHPSVVQSSSECTKARVTRLLKRGRIEQLQAEGDRILSGGMSQFVQEALNDECIGVVAGGSHRAGLDAERHQRGVHGVVWH